MLRPFLGALVILTIILSGEALWRKKILKTEWSRKFIHIGVGTFVAFWPFFTTFHWVEFLALAFGMVIAISRWLHIFQGIHSVKRKTLGELFYPLGIGLAAALSPNKYVFVAAVLHLSLADALAAIIGILFGKRRYHIGDLTKSYVGTATFFVVSLAITGWLLHSPAGFNLPMWPLLAVVPLGSTLIENIAPYGSDNLFIPLSVIGFLGLTNLRIF